MLCLSRSAADSYFALASDLCRLCSLGASSSLTTELIFLVSSVLCVKYAHINMYIFKRVSKWNTNYDFTIGAVYTGHVCVCKADVSSSADATYNASLVTVTAVSMTAAKFKPTVVSVFGCALSIVTDVFIDMALNNLCLLLVRFCDEVVHTRHFQSHMQMSGWYALWNVGSHAETCFSGASVLEDTCLPQILRLGRHVITGILSSLWRVNLLLLRQ